MSKKYEGLIVFNMKGTELTVTDMIKLVTGEITEEGAQITETADLGRREFANESRHLKGGQYVSFTFSACPCAIRKIRERLSINDHVHYQYYKRLG